MPYENRIVAFIDILGFKDLLDKTVDKEDRDVEEFITVIREAYGIIRDAWNLDEEVIKPSKLSEAVKNDSEKKGKIVTIFSDTIVVSFLQDAHGEVFYTLLEIKWMIMELVNRGILCRGALAYGKLIHTEKMIFGPALVEAYLTENKAALYPRVIVGRELIQLAAKHGRHPPAEELSYIKDMLKKDTDGMYYIDYFLGAQNELDDPEFGFPQYLIRMSSLIKRGIRSTRPDVKIKYMWMKEKVNEVIAIAKSSGNLANLDRHNPLMAKVWRQMKKV